MEGLKDTKENFPDDEVIVEIGCGLEVELLVEIGACDEWTNEIHVRFCFNYVGKWNDKLGLRLLDSPEHF